jgi:hypothetical protein
MTNEAATENFTENRMESSKNTSILFSSEPSKYSSEILMHLPSEILQEIANDYLDSGSAACFALTCRGIAKVIGTNVWQKLKMPRPRCNNVWEGFVDYGEWVKTWERRLSFLKLLARDSPLLNFCQICGKLHPQNHPQNAVDIENVCCRWLCHDQGNLDFAFANCSILRQGIKSLQESKENTTKSQIIREFERRWERGYLTPDNTIQLSHDTIIQTTYGRIVARKILLRTETQIVSGKILRAENQYISAPASRLTPARRALLITRPTRSGSFGRPKIHICRCKPANSLADDFRAWNHKQLVCSCAHCHRWDTTRFSNAELSSSKSAKRCTKCHIVTKVEKSEREDCGVADIVTSWLELEPGAYTPLRFPFFPRKSSSARKRFEGTESLIETEEKEKRKKWKGWKLGMGSRKCGWETD